MTKKKQPSAQVQMLPMSAVEINAGQLEGLPANPREIRDEKFEKLKANIKKYPELLEYRSLMVYPMPNGKHIIIGGNMRYRAMQELGYTEVPCVIIPAETPVERLGAYTILDNNGFGKWDWDLLANEWSDWNMEDLGLDWDGLNVSPEEFGEEFALPSGEKSKIGTMTFCVTERQRELVNLAVQAAQYSKEYDDSENKNGNGSGLELIARQWVLSEMNGSGEDDEKTLRQKVDELREYLCESLSCSGHKASDVDKLLGTSGMAGHYFGASQWMFPTLEAYEKMKEIMQLPRDHSECMEIVRAYERAKIFVEITKKSIWDAARK